MPLGCMYNYSGNIGVRMRALDKFLHHQPPTTYVYYVEASTQDANQNYITYT